MSAFWSTIISAVILGPLVVLIQRSRKENKNDHNTVASVLLEVKDQIIDLHSKIDHVDEQVDKVDDQMQGHMMWHYKKSTEAKKKVEGA